MKLYSENENYKLYHGNMLDMLDVIEPSTIDSIVTDPPYGLTSITKRFGKEGSAPASSKNNDGSFARLSKGFMGKEWDGSGIEYNIDTWEKCYEVLKPGGYLLAFGGSRTFHRIACAIEDAGFEIRDTIMWIYGSGFPKSMDISKQIDKKGGNDYSKQFAIDLKQARESRNLTMKYCDDKYCGGPTNWSWYEGRKDGCRVPDYQTYLKIIKEFPELEKYKELIKEAEREVIGTKKGVGCFNNDEHYTVGGTKANDIDITIPSTDLAKQWQGWGTALKPSFEPIIVARKPFKGSLVDNVVKNGVGGINIDECRVKHNEPLKTTKRKGIQNYGDFNWNYDTTKNHIASADPKGRFPANIILTYDETDFDEVCGGFPYTKTGSRKAQPQKEGSWNAVGIKFKMTYACEGSEGSASRYFYCAKASKRDRDEGLDEFETKSHEEINNRKEGSAGATRQYGGGTNPFLSVSCPRKNTHPTVKPTSLMQYLVRLVTPNGGTVLDPFNGSGSTGKAVMYENHDRNKDYKYIGIELTEEYLPIAKARIEYVCNLKEEKQTTIEDFIGGGDE